MIILSKEELEKLDKGNYPEALGIGPKNDLEFTLEKQGQEGVKKVEKEMEKLGYPIKYKEIKTFQRKQSLFLKKGMLIGLK